MNTPKWLKDAVVYEIYPQSFSDSNNDGIGDIPGIIKRLDYIESLGVNAIWLNPCFESPFKDAGYDVSDFCKVAPRYGSNEDLKELFDRSHAKGIKVILDLVAGHTSLAHPWFQESCKAQPNKYSNYYIWTNSWGEIDNQYRFINGYAERNGNFMINFFSSQPALNYGFKNPDPNKPWQLPMNHPDVIAVREELRSIMKFWLDMGADGFRVDMAPSLVRGDEEKEGIKALWEDYRSWLDKNYPEAVLISEWSHPAQAVNVGFHIDFMVHFGLPGYTRMFRREKYRVPNSPFADGTSFFDKAGNGDAKAFTEELLEQLESTAGKGYVSIPTGNHDIGRIRQGRSLEELKGVYTCIFTLPGVPFLYYGDEIGMDYVYDLVSKEGGYNRTGARTPMQWDTTKNAGFSQADASQLYLPIDPSEERPTVAGQEKEKNSLLNFVRELISLRRSNPALSSDGKFIPLYVQKNQCPLIYERTDGKTRFIIAVNPSCDTVNAEFACRNADLAKVVIAKGCELKSEYAYTEISMAPASYAIYQIG